MLRSRLLLLAIYDLVDCLQFADWLRGLRCNHCAAACIIPHGQDLSHVTIVTTVRKTGPVAAVGLTYHGMQLCIALPNE